MTISEDDTVIADKQKSKKIVKIDAKKVLVGAGARVLFYPTLLYNVLRFKIQSDFRWWDEVVQFLFLGAVPFPKDVPKLKQLGVGGVITLNEPFETLVPPSLYKAHGMEHLVIPTRDYVYAPSLEDINRAVDFIHNNASCGRATYVHCKAGRGRSTTVALCYLAVQQYYLCCLAASGSSTPSDEVLITKDDLEGYNESSDHTLNKDLIPKAIKVLPVARRLSSLVNSVAFACGCVSIPSQQVKMRVLPLKIVNINEVMQYRCTYERELPYGSDLPTPSTM